MKTMITAVVTLVFLGAASSLVLADSTLECTADSTLAGNDGFVLTTSEPGFPSEMLFAFAESGMVRVFAAREPGFAWDIFPTTQFLCPTTTMGIGNTWRFLDDDDGETLATVIALENVTTTAGIFSAYRVDVTSVSAPGVITQSIWFADGVGMVRTIEYSGGVPDQTDELSSFTIASGSGFMPLWLGNIWDNAEIIVPTEETTWGAVKAQFE